MNSILASIIDHGKSRSRIIKVIVILISRGQIKFGKSRRQLTTGNIAHGKSQKRQSCVSIIIRQQKCYVKYDSVDLAPTIVTRSFSKHECLVGVSLEKSCIFPQGIFKKMPPGTPRNRIRDFPGAKLLVVKGFPKLYWFGVFAHAVRSL